MYLNVRILKAVPSWCDFQYLSLDELRQGKQMNFHFFYFQSLLTTIITIRFKSLALYKRLDSYSQFNFSSVSHGKKRFFSKKYSPVSNVLSTYIACLSKNIKECILHSDCEQAFPEMQILLSILTQ